MNNRLPIYIGNQAIDQFLKFCNEEGIEKFYSISDENTFNSLETQVYEGLKSKEKVVIIEVLNSLTLNSDSDTFFIKNWSQNSFVSFPTPASEEAYTSHNAPVKIGNMKGSIYCQVPKRFSINLIRKFFGRNIAADYKQVL